MATDIFTLNTALAATIEDSMVKTLNDLRSVWDPKDEYETYAFVRQPQTFPDVVLRRVDNGEDVLLGIELKGWYLLAKEEAPTYRFTVPRRRATGRICSSSFLGSSRTSLPVRQFSSDRSSNLPSTAPANATITGYTNAKSAATQAQ